MASEDRSVAKRARLDVDGDGQMSAEVANSIADVANRDTPKRTTPKQPDPSLLAAARLKSIIQRQPSTEFTVPASILAWSASNTIAIARSTRITLVHVLSPSRICHITTSEKPNLMAFSPRGDALLASFPESRRTCLWVCARGTLNEWQLRGEWQQWEGRLLDVRWLGAGRRLVPNDYRRTSARGPQLAGRTDAIAALLVTDAGQTVLLKGRIHSPESFEATLGQIALAPQQRLQQATIGLVPDEATAIIAYTLRLSSKASLSHASSGVEEALGMFFDDVQVTDAEGTAPPSDGDDRIELSEVRIEMDFVEDQSALFVRPLLPIFTASLDDHTAPLPASINQLVWIDSLPSANTNKEDGPVMQLLATHFESHTTTIRLWPIKREETDRLSDAFSKLESAKDIRALDAEEDWVAQAPRNHKFEGQQLSDFVANAYAPLRFICFSRESRVIATMADVPRIEAGVRLVDMSEGAEQDLDDAPMRKIMATSVCRLALSPHGTMAVALVRGKMIVSDVTGLAASSFDSAQLYAAAVLQEDDLADLTLSHKTVNVGEVSRALRQNAAQLTLSQAKMLSSLHARSTTVDGVVRRSCHIVLDLCTTLSLLAMSREAAGFKFASVWVLVARLEWMLGVLEVTARQAHLLGESKQQDDTSAPTYIGKDEPDMLSLFAHEASRKLACTCIMKLVAFCNWLDATMNDGGGGSVAGEAAKQAFKSMTRDPYLSANVLRLAHVRVLEALLQSAVDVSKAGRCLKTFKSEGIDEVEEKAATEKQWYLAPTATVVQRASFARAFLPCVRNVLDLFCPQQDWSMPVLGSIESDDDDDDRTALIRPRTRQRDILTKAMLQSGAGGLQRRLCLTCKGQTEVDVTQGEVRCVCGATTWWATQRKKA